MIVNVLLHDRIPVHNALLVEKVHALIQVARAQLVLLQPELSHFCLGLVTLALDVGGRGVFDPSPRGFLKLLPGLQLLGDNFFFCCRINCTRRRVARVADDESGIKLASVMLGHKLVVDILIQMLGIGKGDFPLDIHVQKVFGDLDI